ncbi:MAG: hypothetical protein ACE5FU_10115 [Nitrospinota bacterium]
MERRVLKQFLFLFLIVTFLLIPQKMLASTFNRPKILQIEVVEGISPVQEKNFEKARAEATKDGKKNAVRLAIGDILGEISEESGEMVTSLVDSNFEKYTHGYSILMEIVDEAFFMNLMSVDLFIDELKKDLVDLELSLNAESAPALLILIDERVSPIYSDENFLTLFSISEDALLKEMTKRNWDIQGRDKVSEIENTGAIRDAINGSLDGALFIGQNLQTDYLLFGVADRLVPGNGPENGNEFVKIEYKIVSMGKKEVISEGEISGTSNSTDSFLATAQALRDAGTKLALHFNTVLNREMEKEQFISEE